MTVSQELRSLEAKGLSDALVNAHAHLARRKVECAAAMEASRRAQQAVDDAFAAVHAVEATVAAAFGQGDQQAASGAEHAIAGPAEGAGADFEAQATQEALGGETRTGEPAVAEERGRSYAEQFLA